MLDSMRETVEVLLAADLDAADRDAVAGYVKRSRELRSWLDSFDVRCVRRTNRLAEQGRSESAESMIAHEGSQSSRAGRQTQQRAEVCDLFALFERALTAGVIGAGHVDALAAAIRDLDDEQRVGLIDREEQLLATAERMRVDDFVRHCREQATDVVARLAAAARTEAAAAAATAAGAGQRPDGDGAVVDGAGDPSPIAAIDPAVAEYERQRAASKMRRWLDEETGMSMTLLALDPIRDAMLKKAYDAHLDQLRASGVTSGLPWRQVEVEALLHAITHGVNGSGSDHRSARSGPAGSARSRAGVPVTSGDVNRLRSDANRRVDPNRPDASWNVPEICVVTTFDLVLDDCCTHGLCETSDGRRLPAASLRRMLCDAVVYPVVLGGQGEVLDQGRARRTVNRQQRRALRAMHRSCAHPGCTVPFGSCRIHHVRWWTRDNGPSDIDNLLPLCETHHHLVHEGGWTLTMTPDRVATWTRPDGTHWTTATTANRAVDILNQATPCRSELKLVAGARDAAAKMAT
jgi:hypothetical protein